MRSTKEVLDHHLKSFAARDLDGVLAAYSADAVFFSTDGALPSDPSSNVCSPSSPNPARRPSEGSDWSKGSTRTSPGPRRRRTTPTISPATRSSFGTEAFDYRPSPQRSGRSAEARTNRVQSKGREVNRESDPGPRRALHPFPGSHTRPRDGSGARRRRERVLRAAFKSLR